MATAEADAVRAQAFEGLGLLDRAREAWQKVVAADGGNTFAYRSGFARVLARLGDRSAALAVADSARGLAPAAEIPRIDSLRSAIEQDCYTRQRPGCADPLADWWVITSTRGLEAPAETPARAEPAASP
jgi:hypothetical protein